MGLYICAGMLAAFGMWGIIWTVLGWLCLPRESGMICLSGTGAHMEADIHRWNRLRSWNLVTGRLIVIDKGLTEQEKMNILRVGREIEFCRPEDLPARLKIGENKR